MKKDRDLNIKRRENVMNKGPKLYQLVGVTLVALGVFMLGSVAFANHAVNNIAGHASFDVASTGVTATCNGCHPRSGQSTFAGDSAIQVEQDFHITHKNSRWLTGEFNACVNCHKSSAVDNAKGASNVSSLGTSDADTTRLSGWASADIYADGSGMAGLYSSNATNDVATPNLTNGLPSRQNVSKALCNRCHGKFTTTVHGTNWISPANGGPFNCTACHDGVSALSPAQGHDNGGQPLATIKNAANDNSCLRCHGGAVKFETEESNQSLTGTANWTQ